MIYVMSDLHGCYKEYLKALNMIGLKEEDTLYILGDVIDRGPESMRLLQDMMMRSNVIPLIGNHEYMALTVLKKLCVEVTEENVETYLSLDDITNYTNWVMDGGQETIEQFRKLSKEEQFDILDYLEEFSLYEEVKAGGRDYILVHGGLEPFNPKKKLEEYQLSEMLFQSPDYDKVYFPDRYLVTGHTPTAAFGEAYKGKIVQKNHHIAMDCGCVYGLGLGVYCLDTREEWYI